jgi:hypothetical protein
MDVFFRNGSAGLAEDYWSATSGWKMQNLPGVNDISTAPSALTRSVTSMDVFFGTAPPAPTGHGEDYWSPTVGWKNSRPRRVCRQPKSEAEFLAFERDGADRRRRTMIR